MRVLAVDPGGTTGLALYALRDDGIEEFDAWYVEGQMPAIESARAAMLSGRAEYFNVEWLAGLFEGEGCISIQRRMSGDIVEVSCASTDLDVIERAQRIVGLGSITERPPHPDRGKKVLYTWRITRQRDASLIIELLLPYLGTRRTEKAHEALAILGRHEFKSAVDAVVVEEFRITASTGHKTRGGSMAAIEIIGALRWICHARGIPLVLQTPADAKRFMTDEKLRRLGWYRSGKDHARDAARHLALYLLRSGHVSPEGVLPSDAERRA